MQSRGSSKVAETGTSAGWSTDSAAGVTPSNRGATTSGAAAVVKLQLTDIFAPT